VLAVAQEVPGLVTIPARNYGDWLGRNFIDLDPARQPE
jgi:hypothetical protein